MTEFKYVISLGSYCPVAQAIKDLSFRNASYPFDWVISESFEKVIELIKNNFDGFLDYDNLYQYTYNRDRYKNNKYLISFFHDFNRRESLRIQLPYVKRKYKRRIHRFCNNIMEPTLLIRYITNKKDIEYLKINYLEIISFFKKYNCKNEILFILNEGEDVHIPNSIFVSCDEGLNQCDNLLTQKQFVDYINNLNIKKPSTKPRRKNKLHNFVHAVLRKIIYRKIYCHKKEI